MILLLIISFSIIFYLNFVFHYNIIVNQRLNKIIRLLFLVLLLYELNYFYYICVVSYKIYKFINY